MKPLIFLLFCGVTLSAPAQFLHRKPLRIPNLPGYVTLKCDFHVHTVFSDGEVWPESRIREAWAEGLDAFAFTDHIEWLPHRADVDSGYNRAWEIGRDMAEAMDLIVLNGAEITREMPMGHINAIGLRDAAALRVADSIQAVQIARGQGAFLIYNHPYDSTAWTPLQDQLLQQGLLGGIEVVNENVYYPYAHRWCLEKNLAMIGTSDTHYPLALLYETSGFPYRPMTLVFARNRTAAGILEALQARRTAVLYKGIVIGREAHLRPLADSALRVHPHFFISLKSDYWEGYYIIENRSDLPFTLRVKQKPPMLSMDDEMVIPPGKTVAMWVSLAYGGTHEAPKPGRYAFSIPCEITNLLVAPGQGLSYELKMEVEVR
ncbi:MAG: Sb-PDE family phosphodiesterase [Bacteroidia bacterium]|nr:Sb-PDE family phosphodiesterase [Bacteroidia bacterium]